MLDPDVRRVLDGTSIAHLATVLPDGSPHTVRLWIGAHGDRIVFLTGPGSRKARNLRRDPRMALSIAPVNNPFEPVIVRGRVAEWLEGDAVWEIIDQLSTKYTGAPYPRGQERAVIVIEPRSRPHSPSGKFGCGVAPVRRRAAAAVAGRFRRWWVTFATVRLRQQVTKGPGSRAAGIAGAFRLIESAQSPLARSTPPTWSPLVRAGERFENGQIVERHGESGGGQQAAHGWTQTCRVGR